MRIILLFALFFVITSTTYLEDTHLPAVTEDEDAEILIKKFNKCTEDQYYDLYTASCQQCMKCPKGKFVVTKCGIFDDTECASCNNKAYSQTRAYRQNCRSLSASGPFKLRDGMRGPIPADIDTPWKVVGESDLLDEEYDSNEAEVPQLPARFHGFGEEDDYEDFFYDVDEELSAEVKDPKTIDTEVIVKAAKPVIDNTGVLEVMVQGDLSSYDENDSFEKEAKTKIEPKSDSDSGSSSSSSESDEKEAKAKPEPESDSESASSEENDDALSIDLNSEENSIADSFKDLKSNVLAWTILTKFFVFLGYCFAVLSLFVTFRYVQNMRRQRTFNVQPLVLTPDQHHDLVRTVNYLQTKRRGPFKYEPLEEFV